MVNRDSSLESWGGSKDCVSGSVRVGSGGPQFAGLSSSYVLAAVGTSASARMWSGSAGSLAV